MGSSHLHLPSRDERLRGRKHLSSIIYHDIFDYPLTGSELKKWQLGIVSEKFSKSSNKVIRKIVGRNAFYLLAGREGIMLKRLARQRYSKPKLKIARRAGNILALIPTVKMVGISGALAMNNADVDSDIDLLIITSGGFLWTTRLVVLLVLLTAGFKLRRAGTHEQKDKLCLNIWMDERYLSVRKRNIFTAHEIAQIVPLVNKDHKYEKLLWKNRWIQIWWPNAIALNKFNKVKKFSSETNDQVNVFNLLIENLAYKLQYWYMKKKITREKVSLTRAFFHPFDWSGLVAKKYKVLS